MGSFDQWGAMDLVQKRWGTLLNMFKEIARKVHIKEFLIYEKPIELLQNPKLRLDAIFAAELKEVLLLRGYNWLKGASKCHELKNAPGFRLH